MVVALVAAAQARAGVQVSPVTATDQPNNLIARWTFNAGSLADDAGGLTLSEAGTGADQTTIFGGDGTVSLGPGRLLTASLDSSRFPNLTSNITIWARLKLNGAPSGQSFLMGLLNSETPADWAQQTFALNYKPDAEPPGFGFFCKLAEGKELGHGKDYRPGGTEKFSTVAIVFKSGSKTALVYVDGQVTERKGTVGALQPFKVFALGRLKSHGGVAVTFDEVRIYSTALTPEWLADIESVK